MTPGKNDGLLTEKDLRLAIYSQVCGCIRTGDVVAYAVVTLTYPTSFAMFWGALSRWGFWRGETFAVSLAALLWLLLGSPIFQQIHHKSKVRIAIGKQIEKDLKLENFNARHLSHPGLDYHKHEAKLLKCIKAWDLLNGEQKEALRKCINASHPLDGEQREALLKCIDASHPLNGEQKEALLKCIKKSHPLNDKQKEDLQKCIDASHPLNDNQKKDLQKCIDAYCKQKKDLDISLEWREKGRCYIEGLSEVIRTWIPIVAIGIWLLYAALSMVRQLAETAAIDCLDWAALSMVRQLAGTAAIDYLDWLTSDSGAFILTGAVALILGICGCVKCRLYKSELRRLSKSD